MTTFNSFIINNKKEILRLAAALGQDDAKKVIDLIYTEHIADGDVFLFMSSIAIAQEKHHVRYSVEQYMRRHPKGEKAKNDDEFVDVVAKTTWRLRDDSINGLVQDIEIAIRAIAGGDIEDAEERFVEMAKSLFPIYTK